LKAFSSWKSFLLVISIAVIPSILTIYSLMPKESIYMMVRDKNTINL
jgi:hypothetical protein